MNNKLTNERVAEILARAEICDDSVLTDYRDIAAAMREIQESRKPQRPVAFLNDAHLSRGHVDGGVTSDDDAPGMIPVYREPVSVVCVSCLPETEFDELQERRKVDSAAPVAWRYRHHNGLAPSIWKYVDSESECNAAPNYQRQPLYITPQPPAVVQEELLSAMEEVLRISDRDHEAWHRARNGISACRTAMLHAGNSPVTPDGWMMVPVEPTAEMISSAIAAHHERNKIQIHDRPAPGPMECAYVAMISAAPQPLNNAERAELEQYRNNYQWRSQLNEDE